MRKHYIDNLRWSAIIILIIYHAAMAWNTWNEPNYIFFEGNRAISSIVVAFSPFLMPLLFILAGISTRYSFSKRTIKQYFQERVRKLLIPLVFGTLVFMPVMTYIADRYNCQYTGTFFQHYRVFFTRFTDMTGADGGFSLGQFWFLIYLFVITVIFVVILILLQRFKTDRKTRGTSVWNICLLGVPIILFHELPSIGGKNLIEYLYLFLLGYYVLSKDENVKNISDHKWLFFGVGISSTVINTYLFLWGNQTISMVTKLNAVTRSLSEWFMILAAIGLTNHYCEKEWRITKYMSQRSFMFYMLHYIWIVLFQYLMHRYFSDNTFLLFTIPIILAYTATFLCCEICVILIP